MKKSLLILLITFFIAPEIWAQQITIVPNPDIPDIIVSTAGKPYSGYTGSPVVYNGSLYVQYQNAASSSSISTILQLARYNSDNTLTQIPNPEGGPGYVYQSESIVFNNKLYIQYKGAYGHLRVGSFDGTTLSLLSTPSGASDYLGAPIIYNGYLYIEYSLNTGAQVLAKIDSSNNITLISNPDASPYGYYGSPIVFNNKLLLVYISNLTNNPNVIVQFDGTTETMIANPDNNSYGYQGLPVVFNNKMYGSYVGNAGDYQILQYDGTNPPTLITNPNNTPSTGYSNFPIVYNGALYFQYAVGSQGYQLAKFDGTTETLIPNPDATTYGFWNVPIIYNNKICFFYVNKNGVHQLAEYNGGDTIHLVPNPDGSTTGYWTYPIVFGSRLLYQYNNAAGALQLGVFDGTTMSLVPNPGGSYGGYPIIFNGDMFMQYVGTSGFSGIANLAYSTESLLPVDILHLTATAENSTTLVQWQTANEINNKEFNVERSADGITFASIGTVPAQPVTGKGNYTFTDNSPIAGMNFYRLKQIDEDGKYNYSKIVSVDFLGLSKSFTVYPNPAKDNVTLTLPTITGNATVSIYTMDGRKVFEEQVAPNTSVKNLNVAGLAAGTYNVVLTQQGKQQALKMVKGSN